MRWRRKMAAYYIGQEVLTYRGELVTVTSIVKNKITVVFDCGYIKTISRKTLDGGKVKNPYFKSVFGVGYLGEGVYRSRINSIITREYLTWSSMLERCYSEKEYKNRSSLSYGDKTVNPLWHNFQVFAEWCQTQVGFENKGWNLDKDLLLGGNKEYGPDVCVFLPTEINNALPRKTNVEKDLPVNVRETSSGKYAVNINGKTLLFLTVEEAESFYIAWRKERLTSLSHKYKSSIDERAFNTLISIF